MKIYLSHSTNFNFQKELYQPIEKAGYGKNFIFPHKKNIKQYPVKKLFSSKKCDLIIAEASFPSTGQGIELGWASDFKIPIICIYKKGSSYSRTLNLITKKFIKYDNEEDLTKIIKKII